MGPDRLSLRADLLAHSGRRWALDRPTARAVFQMLARDAHEPTPAQSAELLALSRRAQVARETDGGAVAVIPLRGIITPRPSFFSLLFGGGGGLMGFRQDLEEAADDDEVASILIDVDSPGGLVDLVPETAAVVRDVRARKPVVAVANTRAASAAYWLASQANEVAVTRSGDVGSIGVYLEHTDWSGWNEKEGLAVTYISAGEFKTEGNPDQPLSDDAREHLQEVVDESYGMFVGDVAAGRGVEESAVREGYGRGRVLSAQAALGEGMVDSVESFDQVLARMVGSGGVRQEEETDVEDVITDVLEDDEEARVAAPAPVAAPPVWLARF